MTDVEIAERIIAGLQDQRDRAAEQVKKMSAERQAWAYAAHVDGSEQAKTKLDALNKSMAETATTIASLEASLVEAKRRLDAAKTAARASDAEERRRVVHGLPQELEACGPAMDRMVERPEGGLRRVNDPPSRVKISVLLGSLFVELRALGVTEARFPAWRYDVCAWQDLRKAILDTMHAGWPGPAQRVTARERDNFSSLLAAVARIVRANLGEQTTERADAAA
jgi:hypothetical protein